MERHIWMGKQTIELATLCLQYIHFKGILFVVFPRKLFPVDEINICHPRWKSHKELYNEIPPCCQEVRDVDCCCCCRHIRQKGNSRTLNENVLSHSRIVRVAILGDSRIKCVWPFFSIACIPIPLSIIRRKEKSHQLFEQQKYGKKPKCLPHDAGGVRERLPRAAHSSTTVLL